MDTDRNGLEVLGREECFRLLASQAVGRIGVTSGALPVVLPVNFALAGEWIVVRTGRGTKLEAATSRTVVAFEVDHIDAHGETGWSVLVTGVAEEVTRPDEMERFRRLPLRRWAPGTADRFIRISTEIMTGRRIAKSVDGSEMRSAETGDRRLR
jgi:nitroimidazol reductase NimA-like FMN-containing flavoprotein (pyridoxamine 5'-phosphate oxidase superfamily)